MAQAKEPGPARTNVAAETNPDTFLSGLSVVVVEDEMMVSLLLEDMLGTLGCQE